ncbi:GpE family phage tail protein [Parasalinivibrio latis]
MFHWPPSDLWELELKDIRRWHREARLRAGSMYG